MRDLRREFGSLLLESGAALHDVSAFLGHMNVTTTSRYLQSTPIRFEQALNQMQQATLFAHYSHTAPSEAPVEPANDSVQTTAKLLN